ncbi:MAG: hypothetical protein GY903_24735 [Fuerstiella sp.]|nr:hypothetical protein [Fuerstiella sp.]MCP4857703.1 hypothetical protein [Fuerstiella sp.]
MKLSTNQSSERSTRGLSSAARLSNAGRSGITLLEVLLATAIFMGSLTAILQVMRVGHDSRLSAKLDSEAALRCESKLSELISGISPLTSESNQPFEDSENWRYTITVEEGPGESLLLVSVRVEHVIAEQLPNSTFLLVRLMRDPQLFLDAAMAAEEAEAEE